MSTDQIRERLDKASKGPWENKGKYVRDTDNVIVCDALFQEKGPANADFIAHAPKDIKYLLGVVGKYKELVEFLSHQECLMEAEGSSDNIECRETENCITEMCFPCQAKLTLKGIGDNHG